MSPRPNDRTVGQVWQKLCKQKKMRITVFNGSARGSHSTSQIMAQELVLGAKGAGAEVDNVFLVQKHIEPCRACFNCWFTTPGRCLVSDDMGELLAKIRKSDIIVFATPLYVDNVSGIMKDFMDRLVPLLEAPYKLDANGECYHSPRKKPTPGFVVVSNCAYPEAAHFQVLKLLFRRMARNFSTRVIAEIYLPAGIMLDGWMPQFRPAIKLYKKALQQAGKEIVVRRKLSAGTITALGKPLVSQAEFIRIMNKYFARLIKRRG